LSTELEMEFPTSTRRQIAYQEVRVVMNHRNDAVELDTLRKELDHYKLHTQLLLQTKKLLEERLEQVSREFEEFKKSCCIDCDEKMNTSTSTPPNDAFYNKRASLPPNALQSALENITFGVTEEYRRRPSLFQPHNHCHRHPATAESANRRSSTTDQSSRKSSIVISRRSSSASVSDAKSKTISKYPQLAASRSLSPRESADSSSIDEVNTSHSSSDRNEQANSSHSSELCQHFLKGRCRYKRQCKFSHDIVKCPYCDIVLPEAKIAASTHLSRCFKLNCKAVVFSNYDQEDVDDELDD